MSFISEISEIYIRQIVLAQVKGRPLGHAGVIKKLDQIHQVPSLPHLAALQHIRQNILSAVEHNYNLGQNVQVSEEYILILFSE